MKIRTIFELKEQLLCLYYCAAVLGPETATDTFPRPVGAVQGAETRV